MQIRSWQLSQWKNIIHVAGREFAMDVCTLSTSLDMEISVRFAIPMKIAKQWKSVFRK
jgi:hypothetical protein